MTWQQVFSNPAGRSIDLERREDDTYLFEDGTASFEPGGGNLPGSFSFVPTEAQRRQIEAGRGTIRVTQAQVSAVRALREKTLSGVGQEEQMTWQRVFSNPVEPKPKFKLGDWVQRRDYPSQQGEVSFIGQYDEVIGGYRYKVKEPSGTRLFWNEGSMVLVRRGRRSNPIVSGYDDPFYIVHGMYEDSRITDEFGSDDEAEALAAAKKLLRSPFFEGDIVRVITRDGEFVWEQRR